MKKRLAPPPVARSDEIVKVYAPFAGRVLDILMHDNGAVVRKGQPLLRVDPDEKVVAEDPAERARRIRTTTDRYLANLL